ncbi:hypothetical protein [Clostridium tagluense]|uniref:hypothetical protein n=1 Tax=Clostridium tagluense TaxID=360422 RepID=UPI001CF37E61|nr:hypothetical protein [Clostridium tagluense]MCB2300579.1 hypothetical protein [Clostridium tagluense]
MKQILKSMMAHFESATTLDHEQYKDWRKGKYIGKDGLLMIVKNVHTGTQHIQWNPLGKDKTVISDKGLVSSNDDVCEDTDKQTVRVKTENSYYYFTNVSYEIGEIDIPMLW